MAEPTSKRRNPITRDVVTGEAGESLESLADVVDALVCMFDATQGGLFKKQYFNQLNLKGIDFAELCRRGVQLYWYTKIGSAVQFSTQQQAVCGTQASALVLLRLATWKWRCLPCACFCFCDDYGLVARCAFAMTMAW